MGRVRARLAGRSDSEHEQVLIRCAVAVAALGYLLVAAFARDDGSAVAARCLPLGIAYLSGSLLLFGHLLWDPGSRPWRRYAGMVLDIVTLTIVHILGEATGAVFYPFYLWVTLGMGFRYGRTYLYASAALSLASFGGVIAMSVYWQQQPALAAGLWAALLMLPAYAATLLAKLTDALERAEAANRTKSRFLATVSHELRTPLNAIIGITDLLHGGPLRGEQRDLVSSARIAGQNLLEMINDVLDVAKIESGRTSAEEVDFDLHALLVRVRDMQMARARAQGLDLDLAIDPAVPHAVRGGERALQQVLINLVANGIKFTDEGRVTIRMTGADAGRQRVRVQIEVEDTGIGIPEDARDRIFEPFAQVDETTTRRFGGTGLGLTIARQLVGLLGGELTLASEPGRGSRFVVAVDLERRLPRPLLLAGQVVVIGDRDTARPWCARVEALGCSASAVHDLAEASRLLLAAEERPAILLLEATMPPRAVPRAPAVLRLAPAGMPDLIVIGERARPPGFLATLAPDAGDELLASALHVALLGQRKAADEPVTALDQVRVARRILLAEDNKTNQKVITRILERGGHAVTLASDGGEALDALEEASFDLVLMDLNMPEMGGIEAAKLYRYMVPARDAAVIAALTADVTEETRIACQDAGICEIITKPVAAASLLEAVDRLTAARERTPVGGDDDPPPEPASLEGAANVVPHPRRASPAPALDPAHLQRLRQLDQGDGFFAEVVTEFIRDAEQLVSELNGAAEAGDAVAFRDRAHALRSSAAHIGARAMFELCLSWRGISASELRAGAKTVPARLATEFERMRRALLEELEPPPHGDGVPPAQPVQRVRRRPR